MVSPKNSGHRGRGCRWLPCRGGGEPAPYVVRIERAKAKVAGSEEVAPMALWVTMIFRREGGTWKVVHRHADAVVTRQPAQSIVDPTRA
jgi:hypothetical protein